LAGEAGRIAIVGQIPSEAATAWSDYNHNIAGIFLTTMSFFAMLSYNSRFYWARFWPVGFMLLGIFLFFRSDAESWPLGPIGFWTAHSIMARYCNTGLPLFWFLAWAGWKFAPA